MTVAEALSAARQRLSEAGVEGAARDARWLMAWAMGIGPDGLAARLQDPVPDLAARRFAGAIARRAVRVPVSHITGTRAFWGRDFEVTPDVLDPRPETERLVEMALEHRFARVLDLGTGSGAILVTLLAERAGAVGVGTDLSPQAVLVAGRNAARHGVAARIVLPVSDWFDDVGGRYDLVVSNPPYITAAEMNSLAPEVRDHEPRLALTDEGDGLAAYRAIADGVLGCLVPGGRLLVEIGPTQAADVGAILGAAGLVGVTVHADLDGRARVVEAHAPGVPETR